MVWDSAIGFTPSSVLWSPFRRRSFDAGLTWPRQRAGSGPAHSARCGTDWRWQHRTDPALRIPKAFPGWCSSIPRGHMRAKARRSAISPYRRSSRQTNQKRRSEFDDQFRQNPAQSDRPIRVGRLSGHSSTPPPPVEIPGMNQPSRHFKYALSPKRSLNQTSRFAS